MGHRLVKGRCLEEGSAIDYYMSFAEPQITEGGEIVYPVKSGSKWYINGVEMKPSLPQCSPAELYTSGFVTFSPLLAVAAVVMAFNAMKRLVSIGE